MNDFIPFGHMVRQRLNEQAQYASRYVNGRSGFPALGSGLRFLGDPADYHALCIHRDDVEEFLRRVEEHRKENHRG